MKHVISLGAGVQSSTMALMAAAGEITPMPDCAIFADTGSEPEAVYKQLAYLIECLPFPVLTVSAGSLFEDLMHGTERASWGRPPFFVANDDGRAGQLRRQCTGDYKIDPIRRKVRELVGLTKRRSPKHPVVTQWIGISTDEATRMKDSREAWQLNRWPIVEKGMNRAACLRWLEVNGHPRPPKSACVFCPYRDSLSWREMKQSDPVSFAKAVLIDKTVRNNMPGVSKSETFIHRSLIPLSEIAWSDAVDLGDKQINMFENECEGMCGV